MATVLQLEYTPPQRRCCDAKRPTQSTAHTSTAQRHTIWRVIVVLMPSRPVFRLPESKKWRRGGAREGAPAYSSRVTRDVRSFIIERAKELATGAGCTHQLPLLSFTEDPARARTCGKYQASLLGNVNLQVIVLYTTAVGCM